MINLSAFKLEKVLEMDPEFLNTDGEHQHDVSVSSKSVRFEGELNHMKLRMWLSELQQTHAKDLFRYKGVLAVKGMQQKFVFQGVHMLMSGTFDERFLWKAKDTRECRLVFIGRNLDKMNLEESVMACKITADLRFKVGDAVVANCDGWQKGAIIRLWDEGNPYRIRLDDGEECWAPVDSDAFIKKFEGPASQGAHKPLQHQPWWGNDGKGVKRPWRAR